ncbi:MAG: DUF1080 domain-containing protein [Balneolaceae bacterium]|nr:DUF1080 domain-containing protein [Balneolaceae bacterium]
MKKIPAWFLSVTFLLPILSNQGLVGQSSGDQWQELFNGNDLSGWQLLNGQHDVEVRDGIIVATSIQGLPNGFLATEEEYGDFILELEVKADPLLHNSGIQFRSRTRDNAPDGRVYGYQAEIDLTPQGWSGGIYDEARRGWLYILEDGRSPAKYAWKNSQWNHFRIEAIGTANRVWLNGIPTSHLVDDETAKGFIALQIHANSRPGDAPGYNRVFMRNVRIQTENLRPSPWDDTFVLNLIPNTLSLQEEFQGFELLFDGETKTNWRGILQSEMPEHGWDIRDGALTIISTGDPELKQPLLHTSPPEPGGGIMMTEQEYGPFELKFEFKQHEEGAIPGIEYFVQESERENIYGRLAANKTDRYTGQWNQGGITRNISDWNQGVIKVQPNGRVEYWLNGRPILRYERDSEAASRGYILLDDYGDSISYRSIKIRELH